MPEPILEYLFIAQFNDGSIIEQNPQDLSTIDPTRNCYYDVLQEVVKGKVIRKFSLSGRDNIISVDLKTGLFLVNGITFLLESEKLPQVPEKFNLIWYHQVSQSQNITFDEASGEVSSRENLPERREYFIGWHCRINGRDYKQKIAVF